MQPILRLMSGSEQSLSDLNDNVPTINCRCSNKSSSQTHAHSYLLVCILASASPLGPRIVPLCCPRVVVDKVYSAIVLALLCGNKQQKQQKKKRGFHSISGLRSDKPTKKNKKSGTILSQHGGGQRGSLSFGGGLMSHPCGRKQAGLCDISLWFVQYTSVPVNISKTGY